MTPVHHAPQHRWRIIALVVLVVGGVALAAAGGAPAPAPAPAAPGALAGAPDAESSAWYCTGQSTASGSVPGFLVLTNTTTHPVTTTVTAVSDGGGRAQSAVTVPARTALTPALPGVESGAWEAQTVVVSGGGLAVSQVVHNTLGWSQSPCQSTTAADWYFPGGTTAGGDQLAVSLFNPTSTPVVVDVSFTTPTGTVHPINYQGIVLEPGQVAVEDVAAEVQDAPTVSTVVSTRTGRVVAAEIQQFEGTTDGLSLVPGVATPQSSWSVPLAQESPGGTSELDVFNPGSTPASVRVQVRLPSGPLAPLTARVPPGGTWALATSAETRIPKGQAYSARVTAVGAGVVVSRTVLRPDATQSPKAGMALAVEGLSASWPSGRWVVPPAGTTSTLAVAGAAPAYLALLNTSGGPEEFAATAETATGSQTLATGTLAAGATALVDGAPLAAAGLDQIAVQSSGPMAVSADSTPSGGIGVVTVPGIALAPDGAAG